MAWPLSWHRVPISVEVTMTQKVNNGILSVLILFSINNAEAAVSKKRPEFKKIKIEIFSASASKPESKVGLMVEVADSSEKWEFGLMFKKKLLDGEGMLFIFPDEQPRQFWMKNTFIDLDIGYFDSKKTLVSISTMKGVTSEMETNLAVYPSKSPAQYALEVPKGWFQKHKVTPNDKLVLP
jgi:uncharacterized protein